ncbi:ChiQ/YbfN family lipoprotein [Enterobacter sp. CC120223-11]|uniref:ChiQ/YbfN family lipoprotein n=1 Tax=Enterobacter sp. CC120223-11 TaxID=1378073 RepID=UPI000BDC32BA|nr:ChiQ/YbfN family lipoprotein [Enterobacter sp. CC120223-11]SNY79202.1 YbfN-like lipoprotein [Enterobacter sp. CC120223-11]
MKKLILVAIMASGLVACAQPQAPKEDSKLKAAYSACINTAEGNPDKVQACQSVLDVLKQEKEHKQFADQETVRTLDYQQCIQATRTGNDQAVKARCDQIWKEIRSNNTTTP